jgi:hypothetical protein
MDINASRPGGVDAAPGSRLAAWIAVARGNVDFQMGASVVLLFMTIAGLILHGAHYAVHIHNPLALLGALVSLLLPALAMASLALANRARRRMQWWSAVGVVALVALFFALLPPMAAGDGWLAVLLAVLTTLTYYTTAAAYLTIFRPWTWMQGAPQ